MRKQRTTPRTLQHLVWEVAYEHWHRMLFARFLAENGLLLWEPGAPVSLEDCQNLVDNHPEMLMAKLGAKSSGSWPASWPPACCRRCSSRTAPVFELAFAPEHQRELERLLAACRARCSRPATAWAGSTSSGRPSARTRSTPRK
jgi:hypothetical protein